MNPPVSLKNGAIALGWLVFVVLGIRLGAGVLEMWNDQSRGIAASQVRRSRLHGWLSVEQEVSKHREEALGPFAHAKPGDLAWIGLEGLQELARAEELTVTDLRPSEISGPGRKQPLLRMDLRVTGGLEKMAAFIGKIPDRLPGVRLESMQMIPEEKQGVQCLLRLSVPLWEAP